MLGGIGRGSLHRKRGTEAQRELDKDLPCRYPPNSRFLESTFTTLGFSRRTSDSEKAP